MFKEEDITLSKLRLDKAKTFCEIADDNFKLGHYQTTNNRAYYAIFHSIRAVLAMEKTEFKSHSNTLGHFNKNYINKGIFDKEFSQIIKKAVKARTDSDYNDMFIATKKEAEMVLKGAKNFYHAAETYLVRSWEKNQNQDKIENQDIGQAQSKIDITKENTVTVKVISETLEEKISESDNKAKQEKSKGNIKDLVTKTQEMKNFKAMVDKVNDNNYLIKINGAATAENIMAQKISIGKQISNIRVKEKENTKSIEKER